MAEKDTPERRAKIRQQIRETSRDEYIISEMKRLGMWPENEDKPKLAEDLIKRRGQLHREISELNKEKRIFADKEAYLNLVRKERMKRSREQQKLNKQKKIDQKLARKNARRNALKKDIDYLGRQYSRQLKDKESDLETLAKNKLPILQNILGLANELEMSVNDLRFLSYDRKLSKVSHYITYGIKKKTGGIRKISAPMPKLKKAQRAILEKILNRITISKNAHGFASGKSIVTNATPHIGEDIVVNMDLKNFFPTIDFKRVFGLFKKLGFSPQISTVLSLICTMPDEEKIKVHGEVRYLNTGKRYLPQGAPTSPMITNIICRRMDARMEGIAKNLGFRYTRYADDMSFSGPNSARKIINKLLWQTKSVVISEDFKLHPDKTRVMANGQRKEVTGIVVNEKANISKKRLKEFRALLFQIEKDGIAGKKWGASADVLDSILGFARYIHMVDPQKGKKYLLQVNAILKKHRPKKKKPLFVKKAVLPDQASTGTPRNPYSSDTPKPKTEGSKPWWKIW